MGFEDEEEDAVADAVDMLGWSGSVLVVDILNIEDRLLLIYTGVCTIATVECWSRFYVTVKN